MKLVEVDQQEVDKIQCSIHGLRALNGTGCVRNFYLSELDKPGIMTVLPHLNIFKYLEAQDDHHHLDGRGFAELKKETCAKHGFSCVLVCVPLLSIVHPWCQPCKSRNMK